MTLLPALIVSGLMLGAVGLLLSSTIRQLENFAGIMNFVIFPMFFLSSALYPLWKLQESSTVLPWICVFNPFTHAVELIRFALYGEANLVALAVTLAALAAFLALAILGYSPAKGLMRRKAAPAAMDRNWRWIVTAAKTLARTRLSSDVALRRPRAQPLRWRPRWSSSGGRDGPRPRASGR